jgi:hypothetical protein
MFLLSTGVALNNINPAIQTTKNYSVNWNGNHQKRDEIDTNSHSFFLHKILNGCNGLRPAYLYEFVQPKWATTIRKAKERKHNLIPRL